jgi:hypothetical protein
VVAPAGVYLCAAPIVIDRDNVELSGDGAATRITVLPGANIPAIVIGQTVPVPSATRRNIRVSNLFIDGNRANQTYECMHGDCSPSSPLRNNGISLRRVEDVAIEQVTVTRARSGGLVAELGCRRIGVRHVTASDNAFDGVALYQTENSAFSDLHLNDNLAAGLSFDIGAHHNLFTNVVIAGSGKVGVFMRDARDNVFTSLQVRNSGEHGIFLAQVSGNPATHASGNTFNALTVSESGGFALRVNDSSCRNNLAVAAQFVSNRAGCVSASAAGQVAAAAAICR